MRSGRRAVVVATFATPALFATSALASSPTDSRPAQSTVSSDSPTTPDSPSTKDSAAITYRGATVTVPRSWPVYDLAKDPTRCVRLDRHAVYLGTPGANQSCPAHVVGRTETVSLQPYSGAPIPTESGTVQARQGNVLITATYGSAGAKAAAALVPPTAIAPPRPAATPAPAPNAGPAVAPKVVRGAAFDTCAAPSRSEMHAWSKSVAPYKAVAIYIGGLNRACPYGNLSAAWVRDVRSYGYRFIPTYVGRQAPCTGIGTPITPSQATTQGLNAARDAIKNMAKFGFPKGSPVYLDMEDYHGSSSCNRAVLQFVAAWVYRLHLSGYRAGLYTSTWASIVRHHNDGFRNPDDVWIARWNGKPRVFGDSVIPDRFWAKHQRIHQYRGSHQVRYGRVTLSIDTDQIDARTG